MKPMHIDFLLQVFQENASRAAIVFRGEAYTYGFLSERVAHWENVLGAQDVPAGAVVSLTGDFSPNSIALFLALTNRSSIIAPVLSSATESHRATVKEVGQTEWAFIVGDDDEVSWQPTGQKAAHALYDRIRSAHSPGLVLFSSGSSGKPKAAVHDFVGLLEKFKTARSSMKILNFLLFDHWGGLNTMLHTLSSAGTVFTVGDRSPDGICASIARHEIEVLPASPSFLNLLLVSKAYQRHDLRSLKVISYGTEPMPESTLKRAREIFPEVKLHQTYGLIELGVMRSKSKSDDSLWVKIGGEGYETRVVDGLLQIKAKSAMLGYLNAPSPFTEDGWFMTGDSVEVEGDYFRILGRKSELINVGGEKVYPQEVENLVLEMDNIREVTVYGEKHPLMGNIVCAKVSLVDPAEDAKAAALRVKKYCRERLPSFKVPVKIEVLDEAQYNSRFKKVRGASPA